MGFKEMAPTSFTYGREKCPGRRNNEPRIRTERTRITEQQKHANKRIQYSIILEKIKRTILHSRMEGKNVLLEEEIMSQGYEQRGRGSQSNRNMKQKNSIFNYFGEN
jgi:hypothetical protein